MFEPLEVPGDYRQEPMRSAVAEIEAYRRKLREHYKTKPEVPPLMIRLEMWADGLIDALNELAISRFYCREYRKAIIHPSVEAMDEKEKEAYRLHVYYYKNAFIRVFSVLDKLGYFLNHLFELKTEKIKARYSYFTVLRQMHNNKVHDELEQQLFDLKMKYQAALNRLRQRRNLEIHAINVEMLDDLNGISRRFSDHSRIEPLDDNINDLELGYEMVCLSLRTAFHYCTGLYKGH